LKSQADITFGSIVADIDKATQGSAFWIEQLQKSLKWIDANKAGMIAFVRVVSFAFKAVFDLLQGVWRGFNGVVASVVENSLRAVAKLGSAINSISPIKFQSTGLIEGVIQQSKKDRKASFGGAVQDFKQIAGGFNGLFNTPKSIATPVPRDIRGTVETPQAKAKKAKKEAKSEAQKEAERYADALKGLKEKARDAMLEVQGMDKAIQALSSGGIKAYEAQLKQNEGLGRYNELMGDYLGKGKKELELLAQSIVKREQDTEAKKKQLELSVSLKEAMTAVNIEEGKQKALRDAFLAGGEKALELKQREIDIEQRKRDLLKDSNATDEQKKQAEEIAKKEDAVARNKTILEKQVADAKEASEAIRSALSTAFDNTITYMVNGTSSFKDIMVGLLRQIAVQLIKVYALQLITGFIGGNMTGGASAGANAGIFDKIGGAFGVKAIPATGGRAGGGSVSANTPYMVGESGREMFVPRSAGNIIPSHAMPSGGGGGVTVINNVTVNTQGGGKGDNQGLAEAGKAISEMIEMKVRQVLKTESRQGGMLQRGFA
jgi:phage-related minor tail protein